MEAVCLLVLVLRIRCDCCKRRFELFEQGFPQSAGTIQAAIAPVNDPFPMQLKDVARYPEDPGFTRPSSPQQPYTRY